MLTRACFTIILFAVPLWCQVNDQGAATGASGDDSRMLTPPPVSGELYPTAGTAEERSNYLMGGLTFTSAYSDNVLGSAVDGHPVSDVSYSVSPTISLDETTSRFHSLLTYSPGFSFYQRYSARNEADQNASVDLSYRLSPHVTVSFRDSFHKSSNVLNEPDLALANPVSGVPQAPTIAVIAPLADVLSNTGNGGITYQFGPNAMVGANGTFTNLNYSNLSQVPGLGNSSSAGGSAFYSHRLSKKHYVGAQYQYQRYLIFPKSGQYETQTHTIFAFYTIYLKPTLSLSFSSGPQHSDVVQPPSPATQAWSPAATASFSWQGRHTSLAGSYSRIISGGGGLLGTYHMNTANTTASWQITRSWSAGLGGSYSIYKNVTPFFFLATPGGHTISGTASLRHQFGEHMSFQAGYTRLHQSYGEVAAIATTPDTNREFISISYQFSRPLGR